MDILVALTVLLTIVLSAFDYCQCSTCDLTQVKECLGDATELSSVISLDPLDLDLLDSISKNYCGHGYGDCLQHVPDGCTDSELAPYRTIVSTIDYICSTGARYETTCLRWPEVQLHLAYCFQLFQSDISLLWGDTSLTTNGIEQGLCRVYDFLSTCVTDVTRVQCNLRDLIFVDKLLSTAIQPTVSALKCYTDSK